MALYFLNLVAVALTISLRVSSTRFQQALRDIDTDTIHPCRGASEKEIRNYRSLGVTHEFIDSLWGAIYNKDLVDQFLNNNFSHTCATSDNETCVPYYQKYTLQDYFYLEDYVKYKAHRLITLPEGNITALSEAANETASDAQYLITFAEGYLKNFKRNQSDLDESNRTITQLAYGNLMRNAAEEQDWFNMHVISIPCIYGWNVLATNLLNDKNNTKNDTLFYSDWIEPNSDPTEADKLSTFLDANSKVWNSSIDDGKNGRWNQLFRTALELEIALFAGAM